MCEFDFLLYFEPSYFREGNDPDDCGSITYNELTGKVCRFANVLKEHGKFVEKIFLKSITLFTANFISAFFYNIYSFHSKKVDQII